MSSSFGGDGDGDDDPVIAAAFGRKGHRSERQRKWANEWADSITSAAPSGSNGGSFGTQEKWDRLIADSVQHDEYTKTYREQQAELREMQRIALDYGFPLLSRIDVYHISRDEMSRQLSDVQDKLGALIYGHDDRHPSQKRSLPQQRYDKIARYVQILVAFARKVQELKPPDSGGGDESKGGSASSGGGEEEEAEEEEGIDALIGGVLYNLDILSDYAAAVQ